MKIPALVAALALALTLTACGGDDSSTSTEPLPGVLVSSEGSFSAPSEPVTATGVLGAPVGLGDWVVTVTKVVENADALVQSWDEDNGPPRGQYLVVYYAASYRGTERSDTIDSLLWSFTGTDHIVQNPSAPYEPMDIDAGWPNETAPGGTLKWLETFDLDPATIEGGTLTLYDYDDNIVDFPL